MDLAAELARFNPDPALANWITCAVQTLVDQGDLQNACIGLPSRLGESVYRRRHTQYPRQFSRGVASSVFSLDGVDSAYSDSLLSNSHEDRADNPPPVRSLIDNSHDSE